MNSLCTDEVLVLVGAVKTIFTLIQIAIPGVLIVLGTIDMFKAMASGDEKKTKEAQRTFTRRMIYAVVAFLIPFIIRLVFNFVGKTITTNDPSGKEAYDNFFVCWNNAKASTGSNNSSTCNLCIKDGTVIGEGISRNYCENNDGECR